MWTVNTIVWIYLYRNAVKILTPPPWVKPGSITVWKHLIESALNARRLAERIKLWRSSAWSKWLSPLPHVLELRPADSQTSPRTRPAQISARACFNQNAKPVYTNEQFRLAKNVQCTQCLKSIDDLEFWYISEYLYSIFIVSTIILQNFI